MQRLDEWLVRLAGREVVEGLNGLKPAARRRWFVCFDRHLVILSACSSSYRIAYPYQLPLAYQLHAPSKNSGSFSPWRSFT